MNQQLSNIELLILQSALSEEERQKLIKEILNADKQWNILEFKLDRTEKVKKTTSVLLEETIEELEKKRKDVEAQNKELEIQNALERVRAVALGMKEPADMLEICKTISHQLELLHVKEIRNVQTAIFYESKGTYMNYEYYAKHDKTFITETSYTNNKIHLEFAEKMLKGNGEFMAAHIIGDEVKDWIAYQKTTNVFIDDYLNAASSLNYYWYSLGPVALGISTYEPLKEEDINLFKRFLKVFELSYTRYLDIEKAIAQAKEAQIEAALEKVRSRSLAVYKSDEFTEVIKVVFEKLQELEIPMTSASINIFIEGSKDVEAYICGEGEDGITLSHIRLIHFNHPICHDRYNAYKKGLDFFTNTYSKEEKDSFYKYEFEVSDLKYIPADLKKVVMESEHYTRSIAFTKNSMIVVNDFEGKSLSSNQIDIVKRFSRVFEQAYIRFLDLQKAEVQAREAEIELGLERVRSRAMAMQTSEELNALIGTVFTELTKLDFVLTRCVILIYEGNEKGVRWWMANSETASTPMNFFVKYADMPFFNEYLKGWYNRELKWQYCLEDENKIKTDRFLFNETELSLLPDFVIEGMKAPDRVYLNASFNNFGNLTLATLQPLSEEHFNILLRFAKVFDLTYTRFNDLKQAEAQVREAQIEAALEKVRSRSLAVHKSHEFKEVVKIVFEKLQELGINADAASINIFIDSSKDMEVYIGGNNKDGLDVRNFRVLYFDEAISNDRYKAQQSGVDFFSKTYNREEKNIFFKHQFEFSEMKNVPDDIRKKILESEDYSLSMALAKHSMIVVNNFEGKLLSTTEIDIVKRFSRVFEQAYVRFLDLQKAEAQTKESQIQLALERARAQSMIMQHSTELDDTLRVFHEQVLQLNIPSAFSFLWLPDEEKERHIFWAAWAENNSFESKAINYPLDRNEAATAQCLVDWKSNEPVVAYHVPPDGVTNYFAAWNELIAGVEQLKPKYFSDGLYYVEAFMKYGCFGVMVRNELKEGEKKILVRFAIEFERAYTRFLDLQKSEAQTRESQIQLALERVRARTMAMQKSDELSDAVYVLFQQFKELGENPDQATIGVINEVENVIEYWVTMYGQPINKVFKFSIDEPNVTNKIYNAWKENKKSLVIDLSGSALTEFMIYRANKGGAAINPNEKRRVINVAFFSKGLLNVQSNEERSQESIKLLERFASVFEQTYTRFLDLEKAEAQAREAQIEASLERVRSKTMAMHNSADVGETVAALFDELKKLGIETIRCGIGIMQNTKIMEVWTAKPNENNKIDLIIGHLDMNLHPLLQGAFKGWSNKEKSFSYELKQDDLINYFTAINNHPEYPVQYDIATLPSAIYHNDFFFSEGTLFAFSVTQLSDENKKICKRFAAVFGQTYRRYLDLKQAEAQAREAQIEAALERVRAVAMSMMKSDELMGICETVFKQLQMLGFTNTRAAQIYIRHDEEEKFLNYDYSDVTGADVVEVSYNSHPNTRRIYDVIKNAGDGLVDNVINKEQLDEWKSYLYNTLGQAPEKDLDNATELHYYLYSFGMGAFGISTFTRVNDNELEILKRFRNVFSLSYQRYTDIALAEAQAKEAKIEAALERVRGRAMAMHSSKDLVETINVFYHEIELLSETPRRCGVGLINKESRICKLSTMTTTEEGEPVEVIGKLDLQGHPVLNGIYNNWLNQKEYHPVLRGNEIKEYYKLIMSQISYPDYPNDMAQYGYFFFFPEGGAFAWTEKEIPEAELQIYRRFTSVLSLTYKRCYELQQAEANAKEAVKQSALDRIRADIASMRTIKDLDRITPLIWNELTILGVPFIRCGVFIMKDEQQLIHTFLSTPDGKAIAAFHIPYNTPGNIEHVISNWHSKKSYIDHWDETAFTEFAKTLVIQGALTSPKQYLQTIPRGGFYLHFLPFLQGMLYVGNTMQLSEDEINLIQSIADAFSTAYARYEDFNKLEAAKQQVDKTLVELKQTQQQLVQSEKMASLGELTAGIAHEIQNPLNFVNNFSEVNKEMLEELKAERLKPNADKTLEDDLINDLIDNSEKINHHGKRADAIVKGMLQHSRKSTGQKESTDINALCDEYLRLSYHGMRAKDKNFNADFKTGFDSSIGKINIVPQDIGRVLLNLFNNAFYAASEKQKTENAEYKPLVSIQTKKINDNIEIVVSDNGNGIPKNIIDKIFQPFFTTKPTGQGTGLGLSLAYDIITKEHNGTIKVESKESRTKFIIELPLSPNK